MSQTDFHTAIALDHVVVLSASGGMVDLFLAAYRDTLVVSFAAAAVVVMVAVAAAQEIYYLVVHRSEEAVVQKGVHTDHAVAVVPLYFLEELLVHPDFLDH